MLDLAVGLFGIFGNVALVTSVLLLLREVRETNRLTRANNAQSLVGLVAPFYLSLAQDRGMADLSLRASADFQGLDAVDQSRYRSLLIWWLVFYENVYYQRRQHYLDRQAFEAWWRDLRRFVTERQVGLHWEEMRHLFQDEFAQAVSEILAEEPPHPPAPSPTRGEGEPEPPVADAPLSPCGPCG
jgi:hypothetical protein